MIQLTVLYGHPKDTAEFDRYYQEKHAPLAKKMPGLKGYTANKPQSLDPQGQLPAYLIAELYFEDRNALQAALQSPEGQAATEDVPRFASGGATVLVGEVEVYQPVSIG